MGATPRTRYRCTDLCLTAEAPQEALSKALADLGLHLMWTELGEDGRWRATIKALGQYDGPQVEIEEMLAVVEKLPAEMRAVWDGCSQREMNLGYDCGDEPWSFQHSLSNETVRRLAAVGVELAWTLYARREEEEGD